MNRINLSFGKVTEKSIRTPNDFVSHMIEHIAWRMGCSIALNWDDEEWSALGKSLGGRIASFARFRDSAAAMGMLDDGSAEALVELGAPGPGILKMDSGAEVDLDWFLSLRCEQLSSGGPLVELLTGLAEGLPAAVSVVVCNLEDQHHTWEGVFRALGTCLSRIFTPPVETGNFTAPIEKNIDLGNIVVRSRSSNRAEIQRGTAESGLNAMVDFEQKSPSAFCYTGAPIAHYAGTRALDSFNRLLQTTATAAGFSTRIDFTANALSSSHVLLEDSGMALGRALREVLVKRMMDRGVNGGGDSLHTAEDFHNRKIRLAVSVEGRKFWRFVPLNTTREQIQKTLIIGRTIMNGLYSEDLDDFFDGLSWGLGCSIMVHIKELPPAEAAWRLIFNDLGLALKTVFEANPYRLGVPPGVKANLA
ncbi:hypothetical protein [Desulfosarcina ovata]|uniref:Uncharacterized protein n=1 Tax=Desulfosarcina ovata subsp. ovata TaxID=2752305 RepID=A0A5K8AGV7_9BACT|nr:hypothetical protein [Desulfosarcina ovata]BBO91798.1 hypothetical protein DSCOOX_49780 [Desulfosarcina ovata subsp. ovata]